MYRHHVNNHFYAEFANKGLLILKEMDETGGDFEWLFAQKRE